MKDVYYRMINVLQCLELRPRGIIDQRAPAQHPKKNPPRSPDTGGGGGSRRPTSRRADEEPGGDGEVEGRALDSMDKLHRERLVFKRHGIM